MVTAIENPAILALYANRNHASDPPGNTEAGSSNESGSVDRVPSYPAKKLVLKDGCYRVEAPGDRK